MPGEFPRHLVSSSDFFTTLFDLIPSGVIVIDEERRIRAANRTFESALGLKPGASIGSCEGAAIGCLNASEPHEHGAEVTNHGCQTCEARLIAAGALEFNSEQQGRAHFQINVEGRLEDITLTLSAAPFDCDAGRFAIVVIEDIQRLKSLRPPTEESSTFGMVGSDPQMLELFDTIRQVGPMDVPVLIMGESGTGKELVANALHSESRRNSNLLVPVNCGALPDGLLESELFGHLRGSFTGAIKDKKGRFQLADKGTIFLDEIGELSPGMQVKFLRVLQNGTFEPVGGENTVVVDARVVCATNRDLEAEVEAGRFRADLFYRLAVVPMTVPPLSARAGDIPALADHFLRRVSESSDRTLRGFTRGAVECLLKHHWPGNVRELENAVRYAVIKSQGGPIRSQHLPPQILRSRRQKPTRTRRGKLNQKLVREALEITKGNKSETARHLGVSRATLYRFLDSNESLKA